MSEIGVEVSNSMAGGHAVRLSWFVFRLICANGLVAQVAGSEGRIVHSGAEERFRKRLYASGKGLFANLGRTKRMIENLASIQFDPLGLAKHNTSAGEQHVIPGAEKASDAEVAKRKAGEPMKPKVGQKPADEGLFGDRAHQTDLVDLADRPKPNK